MLNIGRKDDLADIKLMKAEYEGQYKSPPQSKRSEKLQELESHKLKQHGSAIWLDENPSSVKRNRNF